MYVTYILFSTRSTVNHSNLPTGASSPIYKDRNLGRKEARKRKKAARKAGDKAGVLPNPPIPQQVAREPVPSKNPSVPKKRKVRSKRYQKPIDPNTLSPHSRERLLARRSRRAAEKTEVRQASKAGIQHGDDSGGVA